MNSKLKRLLRKIKKIDPEAYKYIKETVLPRYHDNGNKPPDDLPGLFFWQDSPQGNNYWVKIYKKLLGEK